MQSANSKNKIPMLRNKVWAGDPSSRPGTEKRAVWLAACDYYQGHGLLGTFLCSEINVSTWDYV